MGNGWSCTNFYNSLLYWRWYLIHINKEASGTDPRFKLDHFLSEVNLDIRSSSHANMVL
jgi:hypothetical protein